MKVAVWRYSLSLQTEVETSGGGGLLTRGIIDALLELGHTVKVCGAVGKLTRAELAAVGCEFGDSVEDCQGAVIATGPTNIRFGTGLVDTYRRLGELPDGATFGYAQWDDGLPFLFRPEAAVGLKAAGFHSKAFARLRPALLSQAAEAPTRRDFGGGRAAAYADYPFHYERCAWELVQYVPERWLSVVEERDPWCAYYGSDRPGRRREFLRWFGRAPVPVRVFGRWSEKAQAELYGTRTTFHPSVAEAEVCPSLRYARCTPYVTDAKYARADYLPRRFFENALAAVPVFYSDAAQPSVLESPHARGMVGAEPADMKCFFERAREERAALVAQNRSLVAEVAARLHPYRPAAALRRLFGP